MAPDPSPNPIPHIPGGSVIVPGFSILLDMAHDAWDMFGSGKEPSKPPEYYGGGATWTGSGWDEGGTAADAEKKAADELKAKTDTLKSLDEQLTGVAQQIVDSNNASRKKLEALAAEIEKELKYVQDSDDKSVVKNEAVTRFLAEKSGDIIKVLTDAAQDVDASRTMLDRIGQDYTQGGYTDGTYQGYGNGNGNGYTGGGYEGYGNGSGGGNGTNGQNGTEGQNGQQQGLGDTLGQAASAIPQALGGLAGANPMGDIGSTIGGLIGRAAENQSHQDRDDRDDSKSAERAAEEQKKKDDEAAAEQKKKDDDAAAEQKKKDDDAAAEKKRQLELQQTGAAGGGTPPTPPAPAPTLVTRPDGTPAQAANSAIAAAARAHLEGAPLADAYKAAGMTLPAPGTILKDTIPQSQATMGDLAMFKDKWVMLLGDNKVYVDGQQQPTSVLGKMQGFMGFTHPPASIMPTTTGAPAAPVAPGTTQQVAAKA